jgi:hypothetical protein
MVWITQEGDVRDTFLSDGESFVFNRSGTALAQAITDTTLLAFVGEAAEVIEAESPRTAAAPIAAHRGLAVHAPLARVPAHQVA